MIAERPGQFTVANYGAVGFGYANRYKASLLGDLNRGLVSNIWVFQKYSYETGRPLVDQNLQAEFQLEPVKEFLVTATEFIRISKVKRSFYPVQPDKKPQEVITGTPLNQEMKSILARVKIF
jgi:hypothetical protein